jgi:hypothetical protein
LGLATPCRHCVRFIGWTAKGLELDEGSVSRSLAPKLQGGFEIPLQTAATLVRFKYDALQIHFVATARVGELLIELSNLREDLLRQSRCVVFDENRIPSAAMAWLAISAGFEGISRTATETHERVASVHETFSTAPSTGNSRAGLSD